MIALLSLLLTLFASPFKSKSRLEAENAAFRHQLIVLQRRVSGRVQLTIGDRLFLVMLYRWFPSILEAIAIIRPETLVRWHRARFRAPSTPANVFTQISGDEAGRAATGISDVSADGRGRPWRSVAGPRAKPSPWPVRDPYAIRIPTNQVHPSAPVRGARGDGSRARRQPATSEVIWGISVHGPQT